MNMKNWVIVILIASTVFFSSLSGMFVGYKIAQQNSSLTKFCNKNSKKTNQSILESNIIPDISESVIPWVVNIKMEYNADSYPNNDLNPEQFSQNEENSKKFNKPQTNIASGSGIILSENGYILTNNHVINNLKNIEVNTSTGKTYKARVIGVDDVTDIAVLKISPETKLPMAKFGNSSKLRIGEWVLAVGSPLGYDQTVTQGIISAINRKVRDIPTNVDFIQTDAAINPGNSGGPLVDLSGNVIGINTAIRADAQNIGFAIPINTAKQISEQIIKEGYVSRPWVGVEVKEFYPINDNLNLQSNISNGVVIDKVWPGSPAEKGGLRNEDLIILVDNHVVDDVRDVQEKIRNHKIGDFVRFEVLRNNQKLYFKIKTEKLPKVK